MGALKDENLMDDVVAWQSSTKRSYKAEKAVDKNKNSCAKTESRPVFRLDLKRPYVICNVMIWVSQGREHYKQNR